jgi:hypothetical protein
MFFRGVHNHVMASPKPPKFKKTNKPTAVSKSISKTIVLHPNMPITESRTQAIPTIRTGAAVELGKFDTLAKIVSAITQNNMLNYDLSRITRTMLQSKINTDRDRDRDRTPSDPAVTDGVFQKLSINSTIHQLLRSLCETPEEVMDAGQASAEFANQLTIPVCTREHHNLQLRSARGLERMCVKGEFCNCLAQFGFIMKEFLTHEEERTVNLTNAHKPVHSMCLYCIRDEATLQFAAATNGNITVHQKFSMQDHQILVNVPGEYRDSDCIPSRIISVYPQILNTPLIYRAYKANDTYHLQQLLKHVSHTENPYSIAKDCRDFQ